MRRRRTECPFPRQSPSILPAHRFRPARPARMIPDDRDSPPAFGPRPGIAFAAVATWPAAPVPPTWTMCAASLPNAIPPPATTPGADRIKISNENCWKWSPRSNNSSAKSPACAANWTQNYTNHKPPKPSRRTTSTARPRPASWAELESGSKASGKTSAAAPAARRRITTKPAAKAPTPRPTKPTKPGKPTTGH